MAIEDEHPSRASVNPVPQTTSVRFVDPSGSVVTISNASDPFSDGYEFSDVLVTIEADGIAAQGWVRSIEGSSPIALHRFLRELADDWRGAQRARSWESIERGLMVRCSRDGLGHVSLTFTLRGSHRPDAWVAEVTIGVEAGEEMARLAGDVERLLQPRMPEGSEREKPRIDP